MMKTRRFEHAMTAATDPSPNNQDQILVELRELREDVSEYKQSVERFNQKFDTYQRATQWVVQLAFSLIAAATVTVIVSTVVGR
ncbi:MAG: hypothetical protein AAFN18_03440 [Cyanobacteria bacterium J06554_6]